MSEKLGGKNASHFYDIAESFVDPFYSWPGGAPPNGNIEDKTQGDIEGRRTWINNPALFTKSLHSTPLVHPPTHRHRQSRVMR